MREKRLKHIFPVKDLFVYVAAAGKKERKGGNSRRRFGAFDHKSLHRQAVATMGKNEKKNKLVALFSLHAAARRRRLVCHCSVVPGERRVKRTFLLKKSRGRVEAKMRPVKRCIQMCERSKKEGKEKKKKAVERVFVI